jgi:hypothetical protein
VLASAALKASPSALVTFHCKTALFEGKQLDKADDLPF